MRHAMMKNTAHHGISVQSPISVMRNLASTARQIMTTMKIM